ncbi:hypothetical protein FK535_07250 [Mycolicibacterium sp. 018/SC-01/001]|uniref:hypothetical protein n=1 Tax=Mycolicibacterium sp. 018/SC-01/001 TaxID=2592069 RepID=UPI00117E2DB1|nr:hypothetical protein [Mycolicibacterium sp. 018/SC-01/001]TRW86252.1 hypothetical protein FK535_07250 [Mycolicibacterium sp. 018/SC-01/001]
MTVRFEPLPRDPGVDDGVAARVHDALWFLCRQWQFGEFRGEDAGSIAMVQVGVDTHRLNRWRDGAASDWRPYDPSAAPLERMVEEERADPGADPRLRSEGGVRLSRNLKAAGIDPGPWTEHYAFQGAVPERAARGLNRLLQNRIGDGARIADGLRRLLEPATAASEAAVLRVTDDHSAAARTVAIDWLRWWSERVPAPAPATERMPASWNDHRLEHEFSVAATTLPDVELRATEYDGGTLDWWSMDVVAPDTPVGPGADPQHLELTGIPAPASFGAMPSSRFWEMEDAAIDLGAIDAAPHDLGRLLMVGYATVYGNDWYVVPLRLPIGTLCQIDTFVVTNVFGIPETVGPAGVDDPNFNLYGMADRREASGVNPWFLLAPVLPGSLESAPVEHVLIARDEMANLAWAIEQRIEDDAGVPYDRFEAMSRPPVASPGGTPVYQVDTFVPDFWYPLAPEHIDTEREATRLRLVPLSRRDGGAGEGITDVLPFGSILEAARGPQCFWLNEEEVPRSGVDVIRSHQRVRWHDGSVHVWTTRRKSTGAGESSSGLRFDTVRGL